MLIPILILALAAPAPHLSARPPVAPGEPTPRQLLAAGGVSFGLGVIGLGVASWRFSVMSGYRRQRDDIAAAVAAEDRPPTDREQDALDDLAGRRRGVRNQAIGIGLAGLGLAAVGVVLLVAGHRASRVTRVAAAPWWTPGGGGLALALRY